MSRAWPALHRLNIPDLSEGANPPSTAPSNSEDRCAGTGPFPSGSIDNAFTTENFGGAYPAGADSDTTIGSPVASQSEQRFSDDSEPCREGDLGRGLHEQPPSDLALLLGRLTAAQGPGGSAGASPETNKAATMGGPTPAPDSTGEEDPVLKELDKLIGAWTLRRPQRGVPGERPRPSFSADSQQRFPQQSRGSQSYAR